MIKLTRPPKPAILAENAEDWTARFAEARERGQTRPPSRQYAHPEIRASLRAMAHGKCAYCEAGQGLGEEQVDHFRGVDPPALAFAWENLYPCCGGCNQRKKGSPTISMEEVLDPCDPDHDPGDHLAFDDERIEPQGASLLGTRTIQKYGLDRIGLDNQRLRALRRLDDARIRILERMGAEGRTALSATEREILLSFAAPQRPFSLMFTWYLRTAGLI